MMKKPSLIPDWRIVIRRAWSFRLLLVAALLTGCEAILPMFAYDLPRGTFSLLAFVVTVVAMVARVIAQKGMR